MAQNVKTQFLRRDHVILNVDGSISQNMGSIAKAKRWSREFQAQNGGIGCGVVSRIDTTPPRFSVNTVASEALKRDNDRHARRSKQQAGTGRPLVHSDERVAGFQRLRKKSYPAAGPAAVSTPRRS